MLSITMGSSMLIVYIAMIWNAFSQVNLKKGYCFAISLTQNQLSDPEVSAVLEGYRRKIKNFAWLSAIGIIIVSWPYPYFSLTMTFLWLYMMVLIGIPFVWAHKTSQALKQIKEERGWYKGLVAQVKVDTVASSRKMGNMPGVEWFLLAMMVVLGPLLITTGQNSLRVVLVVSGVISVIVAYGMNYFIKRMPNRVYTVDSDMNYELNFQKKRDWTWFSVVMAFEIGLLNLVILGLPEQSISLMSFVLLLVGSSALPGILTFWFYRRQLRRLEKISTIDSQSSLGQVYADDERYWYAGCFYNNPNNRRVFVSAPGGGSVAVNYATRGGKVYLWGSGILVAILVIPLWILTVVDEIRPFKVLYGDQEIAFINTIYKERVPIDAIKDLELLDQIKLTFKSNGSATNRYAVGYFTESKEGPVKVFLWGEDKLTLKITLDSGEVLLVRLADAQKTRALLERLKGW